MVLIYVDTDNDGKSDAVTDVRLLYSFDVFQGGSSTGYSGGGSSGGNSGGIGSGIGGGSGTSGGGTGGGLSTGGSGGTGNSLGTGGSGLNNGTGGSGSGTDNTNAPTFNGRGKRLDTLTVDPLKWDSWVSNGVVPSKPTDNEKDETEEKPKADSLKCVADPLINMQGICGTPGGGIKGGRFMYRRNTGTKHKGTDLKADIGTPVYAMFSGKVTKADDRFDQNMAWKKYPDYFPDRNDRAAGNRVWIEGTLANGDIFLIKYFHLKTVNKELINTIIQFGTAIGTVGTTGAACSDDSGGPHLHVEVFINGQREDPEQYFYTKFDENGNPINQ